MPLYEIVNPSDPYTLEAPDFRTAVIASVVLDPRGAYGLHEIGGSDRKPIFLFGGGAADWITTQFGMSADDLVDAVGMPAIADCLDSVLIGRPADREAFRLALSLIDDPEKRQRWRAEWHDKRRSSLNDIGARAWETAAKIRSRAAEPTEADRP